MFFFVQELRANERARVIYLPLSILCGGKVREIQLFVLDILKISIRAGKWGKTRHNTVAKVGR